MKQLQLFSDNVDQICIICGNPLSIDRIIDGCNICEDCEDKEDD